MRWRQRSADFRDTTKEQRVTDLAKRVDQGEPIGILAYDNADPIGWCSIALRESYQAILASRVIPQVPGERVWSVVCFFVAARARRQGLRAKLLDAATKYAAEAGAAVIEAYPSPNGKSYRYMGTPELYRQAGFEEIEVPDGHRPVMRKRLS